MSEMNPIMNPFASAAAQTSNNNGGSVFAINFDAGCGGERERVPSGWYNIEVVSADNSPSKSGKAMLTLVLKVENEIAKGEVMAFIGSWNKVLFIGLSQIAGFAYKTGLQSFEQILGAKGYAYVQLKADRDGNVNNNVTCFAHRAKMIQERQPIPGFLPVDEPPAASVTDDELEAFPS